MYHFCLVNAKIFAFIVDAINIKMQELSVNGRVVSPYAIRIPLMWKRMKEQMLALSLDSTPTVLSTE